MTEQITRNRIALNANSRIRDRCNSGISWGTNNYPANSDPAWFGGPTSGLAVSMSRNDFSGGEPSVTQAVSALRTFANRFAAIRTIRILIYRSKSGYSSGNGNILEYDGTAVAHSAYSSGAHANSVALSAMREGVEMDLATLNSSLDELWNAYVAGARNTVLNRERVICHTSCHSNCHCARGRR